MIWLGPVALGVSREQDEWEKIIAKIGLARGYFVKPMEIDSQFWFT